MVGLGILLHFLYEWSGESILLAPISAVNESTWEHMKLLFVPMFLYAIIQSFFFKDYKYYWQSKAKMIITGLILIPTLYYLYNGIIGKSPDWVNIAIFVLSVFLSFLLEIKWYRKDKKFNCTKVEAIVILCFIYGLFILYTFYPMEINLFLDESTNSYGINK